MNSDLAWRISDTKFSVQKNFPFFISADTINTLIIYLYPQNRYSLLSNNICKCDALIVRMGIAFII